MGLMMRTEQEMAKERDVVVAAVARRLQPAGLDHVTLQCKVMTVKQLP
jgi:hypothetical protein